MASSGCLLTESFCSFLLQPNVTSHCLLQIFPVSDSSETVIDALKLTAQDAGVLLHTNTRVESVERPARGYYLIRTNRGRRFHADYVVVATGSARAAYDWVAAFGHEIVSPVPSLFTLKIRDNRLVGLAGVSVSDSKICLKLPKSKRRHEGLVQRGPLLITHWGLSGPAVLALSAFGARLLYEHKYSMDCVVDWVPALTFQEKLNVLLLARKTLPQKGVLTISPFRGGFPKRLWRSLMANSSLGLVDEQKWADVGNTALDKMAQVMHRTCFRVMGKGTLSFSVLAFVCTIRCACHRKSDLPFSLLCSCVHGCAYAKVSLRMSLSQQEE